ncbi:MAG: hypothetical protein ABIJ27_04220 [Candidatus Omnitrophota bacterium]
MKKSIILIGAVTLFSLLYVHQQTELVKLGYAIADNEKQNLYLLDQREKLVYNLNNLKAPLRLEQELAASGFKFTYPSRNEAFRVVKKSEVADTAVTTEDISKNSAMNRVAVLFGLRTEAQAQE